MNRFILQVEVMTTRVEGIFSSSVIPLKRASLVPSNASTASAAIARSAKGDGVARELTPRPRVGTAIRLASAMGFTGQVLDDMRARLDVALQSGQPSFTAETMDSVQRVAEMTRLTDPVQWPDVPPRELEAGEVLLPLRRQLAESLRAKLYQPDLEQQDPVSLVASVEDARQRLEGVSREMAQDVESVVRGMFRAEPIEADAEALRKEVREVMASDPQGAVKEAAGLRAEDVLGLVR